MSKLVKGVVGLAIVGTLVYVYRGPLQTLLTRLEGVYLPCQQPITYSIGSFDPKFGISQEYFLSALRDAEAIWEKPSGRDLFAYKPDGALKINLIYDYRQQATVQLQKLGLTVGDDKASYDKLKAKYDTLEATYKADRAALDKKVADFKARQSAYEQEVAYWNARHGAPKDVYDRLQAEQAALTAEAASLTALQAHVNDEAASINALATALNGLVSKLNLQVAQLNTIGESRGSEFEEGNYQSDPTGEQIDIYEFENREKLVRVLAHELGHALGLQHVDDPQAIMYRLNNGVNGKLTAADLTALKALCGIK